MSASGPTGKNFASVDTAAGPSTVPAAPPPPPVVIPGTWITPSDYGHEVDTRLGPFAEVVIAQWAISHAALLGPADQLGIQAFLSLIGRVIGVSGPEDDPTVTWRVRFGGTYGMPDGGIIAEINENLTPPGDPISICVVYPRADVGGGNCAFLKVTAEGLANTGVLTSAETSGVIVGVRRVAAP